MYYTMIILSVVLFGGAFALNDVYQKQRGSSIRVSMEFLLISSLAGLAVLLAVGGFKLECTPFTLIMALLSALASFGFTLCTFKALGTINLSLYSLFSMLGGMVLPSVVGIAFYAEGLNVAKIVCFVLICGALLLTVEKSEKRRGSFPYYLGIFLLNGTVGSLAKVFTAAPFPKTSPAGFTLLQALCSALLALVALLILSKGKREPFPAVKAVGVGALFGVANRVANYLLVVALSHVDASVQYPMVTGGVMIVSTLICFFGKNKPSKKELLSVLIAFIAMLALFLIPV